MERLAVIDYKRCDPGSTSYACIRVCPLVNDKKNPKTNVIKVKSGTQFPIINQKLCLKGNCGICVNACFRRAIRMVNLPAPAEGETPIHSYGENSFRLFGLPQLRKGSVIGLLGPNGIGKTTVINVLSGHLIPNTGKSDEDGDKLERALEMVRVPGMREYLRSLHSSTIRVAIKGQVLEKLQQLNGDLRTELARLDTRGVLSQVAEDLTLTNLLQRRPKELSGGELQRFALARVFVQDADVYLFDEPLTYLDVKQRLHLARLIRSFAANERYCLVVDHDLSVLDYMVDLCHVVYGESHALGLVSSQSSQTKAINAFLLGRLKAENVTFRSKAITFRRTAREREWSRETRLFYEYSPITGKLGDFNFKIDAGEVFKGEVLCILGENGLGKTTFANIISGIVKLPERKGRLEAKVSYKPQHLSRRFEGTVGEFLTTYADGRYLFTQQFKILLLKPLGIWHLIKRPLSELSGGELQRTFLAGCLCREADVYIIDEASAFLDVEERLKATRVIRHWAQRNHAILSIEHDIQIADAIADRLMLFFGEPGVYGKGTSPLGKQDGMNRFLKSLDITFRRDEETGRARINKKDSRVDRDQRRINEYYYSPRTRSLLSE
ncbi:MAG: ribosome biogenesis/translation initiation ATPase RLI [Candidatus Heimdallarchaeota archaeon]